MQTFTVPGLAVAIVKDGKVVRGRVRDVLPEAGWGCGAGQDGAGVGCGGFQLRLSGSGAAAGGGLSDALDAAVKQTLLSIVLVSAPGLLGKQSADEGTRDRTESRPE